MFGVPAFVIRMFDKRPRSRTLAAYDELAAPAQLFPDYDTASGPRRTLAPTGRTRVEAWEMLRRNHPDEYRALRAWMTWAEETVAHYRRI